MWLWALLSLAAIHEALPLRDPRQFNIDPSAISNIELLVPVGMADDWQERDERDYRDDRSIDFDSREDSDSDESFSSIPANAFILDQNSVTPRTRALPGAPDAPKYIKNRSFYLTHLWPRTFKAQSKEQSDRESDSAPKPPHKVTQEACRTLARQQKGRARELLMYLCQELIDVLGTRCDCCEDQWRSGDRYNRAKPLFGPLGGRRELPPKYGAVPKHSVNV